MLCNFDTWIYSSTLNLGHIEFSFPSKQFLFHITVQFSSVTQLCPTLCDPMDCSMPGFPGEYSTPGSYSNSCQSCRWCHPTISSSVPFASHLQSFPAAYWRPSNLGDSSFSVISFCPCIQFMRFSWLVYWSGLPFPPPMDHVLSELPAMTHLSLLRGKSEVMIYVWNLSSCRWDLKPKNRLNNLIEE